MWQKGLEGSRVRGMFVFAKVIKGIVVSVTDLMQQLHVFPSPDHVLSINETREGCIYIYTYRLDLHMHTWFCGHFSL